MGKMKKGEKTFKKSKAKKGKTVTKRHGEVAKKAPKPSRGGRSASNGNVAPQQRSNDMTWNSAWLRDVVKDTFVLGQKFGSEERKVMREKDWDFQAVVAVIRDHPDSDAYFVCQPEMPMVNGKPTNVPVLHVFLVPRGQKPPPQLVSIQKNHIATETILPMRSLNLFWKPLNGVNHHNFRGKVYILQCSCRNTKAAMAATSEDDLYKFEYATPWTMKPSVDWKTEANDDTKLSVRFAKFQYILPDGVEIDEGFDRDESSLSTFIPDFLDRYDLGEEHDGGVKTAIQNAFKEKRTEKQAEKELLENEHGYDRASLEAIRVVKVYPSNDFIMSCKSPYVNKYYGKATEVYPKDAMDTA